MPLCPAVRSCGCAVVSNSLAITGDGTGGNPWQIEVPGLTETIPTYSFADNAERDGNLTAPVEGQRVWIRGTHEEQVYTSGAWRVWSLKGTYVPVLSGSGWALGSTGSATGQWVINAGEVTFTATLTFGGTGMLFGAAAAPIVSIPIHAHPATLNSRTISTNIVDNDTSNRYAGRALMNAVFTSVTVTTFLVGSTRVVDQSVTSTVPHAWATGDSILLGGTYLTDV
jgi:hypothetical protein